jgi:NAD(P)-dependent dehydrogenase (short-subunit alcohol dehydrogenase family)
MSDRKVALVAGGSGGIGEGIVAALMSAGYLVYVPTREGDQSPRLQAYVADLGELRLVPADLCDEGEVTALRDTIVSEQGRIDAVVVSVGAYYYGHRMHRMPREDWDRSVQDNLVTHFNLQRAFVDQLRRQNSGSYITLTGPEAESIHPDEGVMSIMAAAQRMMSRVVAYEAFDSDIRVHTITVHTSIRTRSRGEDVNPDWINSRDLGSYVAALVEGTLPGAHEVVHELEGRAHVESILKKAAG